MIYFDNLIIHVEYDKSITKINYNHHTIANDLIFKSVNNSLIKGNNLSDAVHIYLDSLNKIEAEIIFEVYDNFVDGFILGLATYMVFVDLLSNCELNLPFDVIIPYDLNSLYAVNKNMFKYISIILAGLSKIKIYTKLVCYLQQFISIWEPLFVVGPDIDYSQLSINIIAGVGDVILDKMVELENKCDKLASRLLKQEQEHFTALKSIQANMQREFDLLLAETKKSLLTLPNHIDSYVLERVHKTIDVEMQLPSGQQIKNLEHRVDNLYEVIRTKF